MFGHEIASSALVAVGLVSSLAGVLASRVKSAGRHGIELEPLEQTLDQLEREATTRDERKMIEALRERVAQIEGSSETSAAEPIEEQLERGKKVEGLIRKALTNEGWLTTDGSAPSLVVTGVL